MQTGSLKIHVFQGDSYIPLENAKITVIQDKETSNRQITQNLSTDSSGITNEIELEAPSLDYSMKLSDKLPYSLCIITAEVPGYKKLTIKGCQIYPGIQSIQYCHLNPISTRQNNTEDIINISANALIGNYPAKIPESSYPIPLTKPSVNFAIIDPTRQVNPSTIKVHDGDPNENATEFIEDFKQYFKIVLASEIYANWPKETIKANAIAAMSFTLNRIFTEWYFGKMKKFHITSSTAYDHKYIHGRNTFASIDGVVDELFTTYIKKPGYEFPLLAQYRDGLRVPPCSGCLSQWGSKELGDKGLTDKEILKSYYGSDIILNRITKSENMSESYPGFPLQIGSTGEAVETIQKSLNKISTHFPLIPKLTVDGILGSSTKKAIETFQSIFNLAKTGTVNYPTWYKISDIYVGVSGAVRHRGVEKTFIPPFFYGYDYNIPTLTYFDEEY
ncbi:MULTISPECIES: peptidoglycan-binding protein [Clostridium]|uniref:Peptidoglycan-binding protein n=1 Tax=Clostridium cibarium TaxID=2762247 RepID=A0ABR8PX75_9CLOT|nr:MULTISPECIES: peptidoglycan-binding protein [Clostridium]MBD7912777.1 peptidoglycan-binding protein [Clostridium cibarium]